MMIRIGQTLVKEEDISAVYPSAATPGKCWLALQNGRTVWARASMREAVEAITGDVELANEFDETEELPDSAEFEEHHG